MPCAESPSDTTWLNLEHPTGRQADSVVPTKQQLQPVWQVKRRSALDRHAAFVKRLERQRLAREKSGQERAESKLYAASRLHTFTEQLRHAILHNAGVASMWRPAAQMLDVKATLDRKLSNQSFASAASQAKSPAERNPSLASKVLDEASRFVDEALRDAPASCNNLATSNAALASASKTIDSSSSADDQPSAEHHQAGTEVLSLNEASIKPQENDEQALKHSDHIESSASVRSIGSKKVNKPAWAMTAGAAHDAEQQEEEDLLAFAGGLEFDKYINQQEDAELKSVLQEMRTAHEPDNEANKAALKKHVVRAINNLASRDVKPIDGGTSRGAQSCCEQSQGCASTFSRATVASRAKDVSRNAALSADPVAYANTKWDTSTKAGSDVGSTGNQQLKSGCGDLLRENPEMKQVHSVASAAALLKRVADSDAA